MDQWNVARDKVKEGPYSRAQLQALADRGALRATDMVLREGTQQWLAAGQVPGLIPATPAVRPPMPTAERDLAEVKSASAPIPIPALAPPLPVASSFSAGAPRIRSWRLIVAGSAGFCTLAVVFVLIVWGVGGRSKNGDPAQSGGTAIPNDATDYSSSGTIRSSLPADYIRLASLITDPYSLEKKFVDASPLSRAGNLDAVLDRLNATQDASLRPAVDKMTAARQRGKDIVKAYKEDAGVADAYLKDTQDRAARGEYIQDVEEQRYLGRDANGNAVYQTARRREDGSFGPVMSAAVFRLAIGSSERTDEKVRDVLEKSRLQAWGDLMPKFGEIYGRRPARADLAALRIATGDPVWPDSLTMVNTAGKLLTDVTVAIDLVYFTDAPQVTSRQVLFLRQWPADQTVYLDPYLVRRIMDDNIRADQRVAANLGKGKLSWRPGDAGLRPEDLALRGLGGVVEAHMTVWAVEAHQAENIVKYPDVLRAGARFELGALNRVTERQIVDELQKGGPSPSAKTRPKTVLLVPPEFKTMPLNSWILRVGPRVAELTRGTAVEQEVQALLADPVEIIRQRRQKQVDRLTQASGAKQEWRGTWAFQTTPQSLNSHPELKRHEGSKGSIALIFEAPPAPPLVKGEKPPPAGSTPRIAARMFNPEHRDIYGSLIGVITNSERGRLVLHMQTPPALPVRPAVNLKKDGAPAQPKLRPPGLQAFKTGDFTIELTGDESGLKGFVRPTSQNRLKDFQFEVVLKSEGK
jgi:hypothetical protein